MALIFLPTTTHLAARRTRLLFRRPAPRILALFILLALAIPGAFAQAPTLPKIVEAQVGFKPHADDGRTPTHKIGLWTPVAVRIQGGANRYDGDEALRLVVECEDSEDCLTLTRLPVVLG